MRSNHSTNTITLLGIFGALIILQAYVPMVGYIRLFPAWPAISTIHLTVILAGVLLGVPGGAAMGLLWGGVSLFKAFTAPGDPMTLLLFQNPVIAIVPRVAVGIVAGLVFNDLFKTVRSGRGATMKLSLAGICGALTNTGLVIFFTWVFFAQRASSVVPGANAGNLAFVLMGTFAINAIAEAAMAAVVVPVLGQALLAVQKRRRAK
ncbi:ECF transporter S component [Lacticaseibacillus camelliae]|uniref:Membrane protein n=1 Tax=Lacticaseibacillus camelliae DSM 22697 = JCM 13995 TaxID=1423730 RepID=A0A0R2F5B4_9LACO|nr:ECF transporter S component [Lacticaseibacillus camelliae]KRN23576.1 membrane protein [Lacticaseibacillus camelliae DSM 22697 = JCM 13995]